MNTIIGYFQGLISRLEGSKGVEETIAESLKRSLSKVIDHSIKKEHTIENPSMPIIERSKEMLKRLQLEKKEREKRKQQEQEKLMIEFRKQEEQSKLFQEVLAKEKEDKKTRRLEKMQEQSLKRREYLEKQKSTMNNKPHLNPLYRKIESNYVQSIEIPELQRRKEELEKKRMLFSPMKMSDMVQHIKSYNDFQQELRKRARRKSTPDTQFQQLVAIERKKHQDIEKAARFKKELMQRRERFGKKINEDHKPKSDLIKHLEIELEIQKSQLPHSFKVKEDIKHKLRNKENVRKPGLEMRQEHIGKLQLTNLEKLEKIPETQISGSLNDSQTSGNLYKSQRKNKLDKSEKPEDNQKSKDNTLHTRNSRNPSKVQSLRAVKRPIPSDFSTDRIPPKQTDYLAERRKLREKLESQLVHSKHDDKPKSLQEVLQKERLLKHMNPLDIDVLESEIEVNNVYVQSIRNKIDALGQ